MPSSCAARTTRRSASTPRRCPSARGRPRAAAQRPLPSMMMATWRRTVGSILRFRRGRTRRSDIGRIASNREDFLFLGRQQLVDLRDHAVGRLLHVVGVTLLIVLGDLVILLELLQDVEAVATDMARPRPARLRRICARPSRAPCGAPRSARECAGAAPGLRSRATGRDWNRRSPSRRPSPSSLSQTCTEIMRGSGTLTVAS